MRAPQQRQERPRPHTFFFQGHLHRRFDDTHSMPRGRVIRYFQRALDTKPATGSLLVYDSSHVLRRDVLPTNAMEAAERRAAVLGYAKNLLSSRFCLVLHGDSATSRRLFDALAAGCVPLIVNDHLATKGNLPLYPWLPWHRIAVFVREQQLVEDAACAIAAIAAMPDAEYRAFLAHGEAAWHELAYCTAGTPQDHCAQRGRAAENLLAVAHLVQRNATRHAEVTRPLHDSAPWYPLPGCAADGGLLQRINTAYMVHGLQLETHMCAPAEHGSSAGYMSTRVRCLCDTADRQQQQQQQQSVP